MADRCEPQPILLPMRGRERVRAGLGVALIHGLIGFALLRGLAGAPTPAPAPPAMLIDVRLPPPPRSDHREMRARAQRRSGAAAPPNLRARAAEIAAPQPIVPLPPPPPPVIVAPRPGQGMAPSAGAADRAGPGSGAGGAGEGTGSGDAGNGEGAGGDFTPPRRIAGQLRFSDYPRQAGVPPRSGTVGVRYRVGPDGRATDCEVTRTSGLALLDATTCRLIERRFRFAPSRDPDGRPVSSILVEDHSWIIQPPGDDAATAP